MFRTPGRPLHNFGSSTHEKILRQQKLCKVRKELSRAFAYCWKNYSLLLTIPVHRPHFQFHVPVRRQHLHGPFLPDSFSVLSCLCLSFTYIGSKSHSVHASFSPGKECPSCFGVHIFIVWDIMRIAASAVWKTALHKNWSCPFSRTHSSFFQSANRSALGGSGKRWYQTTLGLR